MKIHALWAGASACALLWTGAAQAQNAISTPPKDSKSQSSMSEVVVTAERRTTNLQSTPIAATVLNQQDLTKSGVITVDQLQFVSPSLAVNDFGQGNDIDIRGIGKGEHNTQTNTGVITYRDGVASFPGYFQEEPYYDVASVEILRGPQGTFSGENSTGGAVIVNTQNPVIGGGYDGYVLAHYGNYNDTGLQGAVNIPISSTLAARLATNLEYRDTFYHIAGLTGDPNLRWGSGRLSLLWTPSSNFRVLLKVDYNYLSNGGYFGDAIINPLTGKVNPTTSLFKFANNYETSAIDQFVRAGLRMDYTLPSGIDLRSVSGFQKGHSGWNGDIDGTNLAAPFPDYFIAEALNETLFSQEVNIISPDTGPVSWILGGYYQHNRDNFPYFAIGLRSLGVDEDLRGPNVTHTVAAFGQLSVKLPAGFQLQGGLRYSDWSTTNHVQFYVPQFLAFFNFPDYQTEKGRNLTGKITLNWQVDPNNFLYAFVATGAKPGGLNTPLYFAGGVIPPPFRQEYVTDYEIGWKSRMFHGHLNTQIGAYYNSFDHFQVTIPIPDNPLQSTEENNPSATKLYGFEASAQAVIGDFSFLANVGVEHSELGTMYAEDPRGALGGTCNLASGPATATCFNLAGHPQTYAPNFTFNLQAQYDIRLAGGDKLTPAITFGHVSSQWGTLFDNAAAGDYLAPRNLLGASLAWTHGTFTVTGYGYNLTDQHYVSALLSPIRIAGAPRQFGVSVLKTF